MKSIKKFGYYPTAIPLWLSIIVILTTITLIASACAAPESDRPKNLAEEKEEKMERAADRTKIPPEVIAAVKQEIVDNYTVNPAEIEVSETTARTWPDGCLGLAKSDEICTQALVEGWLVTVSDGDLTWVYRTDNTGFTLRLESESN